jgi:hypothetical protein
VFAARLVDMFGHLEQIHYFPEILVARYVAYQKMEKLIPKVMRHIYLKYARKIQVL